jgi:mRNA interferase RelE/StbE
MTVYRVLYKRRAQKALRKMPKQPAIRIPDAIELLAEDWRGDVKRLANHEHAYRLRVGNYRVLFDREGSDIIIQDIRHRQRGYG